MNEIDGNLTLALALGGLTELHWQGKLRGVEFDPIKFRFEGLTCPDVKDVKGREVQLPVLRPMSEEDAEARKTVLENQRLKVLRALDENPNASLAKLGKVAGLDKNKVDRALKNLEREKPSLARNILGKWETTKAGKGALGAFEGANVVRVNFSEGCANDDP